MPDDYVAERWCGLDIRPVRAADAPFPMWIVRAGPAQAVQHLLSDAELSRVARFRTRALQDRYASGHAALRLLIEQRTGIRAQDQRYQSDDLGKPQLVGRLHIRHNISHSGDRTLIGIDTTANIGVDLERVRGIDDRTELAREYFTPRERMTLRRTNGRRGLADRRFLTIWTRKEACVKALGTGLQMPLQKLHCGAGRSVGHLRFDQDQLRNGVLDQLDGYLIAWAQISESAPR